MTSVSASPATASAASRSNDAGNTASRRNTRRSGSPSRSWDHDTAACRVRWRSWAPRPADEQAEPLAQAPCDLRRGHRPHPRRGQLDRQRDPVELARRSSTTAATFASDERERVGRRRRPLHEQPDRRSGRHLGIVGIGDRAPRASAPRAPSRRRRPTAHARSPRSPLSEPAHQDRLGQRRGVAEHVLAVVQHDQHPPVRQVLGPDPPGPSPARPSPPRPPRTTSSRRAHRRQLHEPHAVGERSPPTPPQPQARGGSCPPRRRPSSVTIRSRSSSPVMRSTSSERPISSVNTVGRFVGTTSTDRNGGNDPSPTWNTSCGAPRSRNRCSPKLRTANPLARHLDRRPRTHDLTAVRDRHQPRRPVHRRPVVVTASLLGLARMDTHPHRQRPRLTPLLEVSACCASMAAPNASCAVRNAA